MLKLFWITMFLLHQGDALISVTAVQLGEPGTFTCLLPDFEYSNTRVKWYKQSLGDTLVLITTLFKTTDNPTFEKGFPPARFDVRYTTTMSTLTILKTIPEDEAVYHCAITTWSEDYWSGTYLSLKGNIQKTTDYTVVQFPTVSDPVQPGVSITLQCSVLSDSENTSCPSQHSVHWFEVRLEEPHANIIYTDGNRHDESEEKPNVRSTPKNCVYRFSKNVSSSDAGTYYCAVATCGDILFGDGTKLDIEGTGLRSKEFIIILLLLCAGLGISVIVMVVLTYSVKKKKCDYCNDKAAVALQENIAKRNLKRDKDPWIYSAVTFTMMKTDCGGTTDTKSVDGEKIYAAVKALGLD